MKSITPRLLFTRLLCTIILAASAVSRSDAQSNIFTVNIVGYVNAFVPAGYSLLANPLDNNSFAFGNTVTNLFASLNPNSIVRKWTASGYLSFVYLGAGMWTDLNNQPVGPVGLAVGEGAVVFNPGSQVTNTFVGDVHGYDIFTESRLPVPTSPPGIYLRGSVAPLGGSGFADIMGRSPQNGDAVLKLDAAGNPLISHFLSGAWVDPLGGNTAPTLNITEAAFFDTTGNRFAGFVPVMVPEPTSIAIVGLGLIGASYRRTKRG